MKKNEEKLWKISFTVQWPRNDVKSAKTNTLKDQLNPNKVQHNVQIIPLEIYKRSLNKKRTNQYLCLMSNLYLKGKRQTLK